MKKVNIERIDRELLALGQGHLSVGPPKGYWQNFGESLKFIYHGKQAENLIVQIRDPQNAILFQSSNWPSEISADNFPKFDRTMDTNPPVQDASGRQRNRPAEAYKACEGKSAGSEAQFGNQRGETVKGVCEEIDGAMVLTRTHPRNGAPEHINNEDAAGRPPRQREEPDRQERPLPKLKKSVFATIETRSGVWRAAIMGSERVTMIAGMNLAGYYGDANRYRNYFLGIVPVVLLLLAGGGWLIAQRALKPVALITRTAEGITHRALNQRVPVVTADRELSRLADVINDMLDRLEKSFGQALRFSADAAHELQTPLTILQGELDNAVQNAPVGSEEQQRYGSLLEEVQHLKAIVQKLLILARADAGRLELKLEPVNISALMESAAEDAGAMAGHLRIDKKIAPDIWAKADADMLAQAVRNLTTNAVKYNIENGFIGFELSVRDKKVIFTISNSGKAIPAGDRNRIFSRFFRIDPSRSKTVSGSGLGLSLALEIVHAHGGELILNPDSGGVISFTISLPGNF